MQQLELNLKPIFQKGIKFIYTPMELIPYKITDKPTSDILKIYHRIIKKYTPTSSRRRPAGLLFINNGKYWGIYTDKKKRMTYVQPLHLPKNKDPEDAANLLLFHLFKVLNKNDDIFKKYGWWE